VGGKRRKGGGRENKKNGVRSRHRKYRWGKGKTSGQGKGGMRGKRRGEREKGKRTRKERKNNKGERSVRSGGESVEISVSLKKGGEGMGETAGSAEKKSKNTNEMS